MNVDINLNVLCPEITTCVVFPTDFYFCECGKATHSKNSGTETNTNEFLLNTNTQSHS